MRVSDTRKMCTIKRRSTNRLPAQVTLHSHGTVDEGSDAAVAAAVTADAADKWLFKRRLETTGKIWQTTRFKFRVYSGH